MLIVFSDLDGTLYPFSKSELILDETISDIHNAIKKKLIFNIATGNGIYSKILSIAKKTKARFIIGFSGAIIYDTEKEKIINSIEIEKNIIKSLYELFLKYHNLSVIFYGENNLYTNRKNGYLYTNTFKAMLDNENNVFELNDKIFNEKIYKVDFQMNHDEIAYKILNDKIKKNFELEIINYDDFITEITAKNVNKAQAIKFLNNNIFKTDINNIMTIGDSNNDIEMIKMTNNGYAIGNANNNVKLISKFKSERVENNGLGIAIKDYIKRNKNKS